MAGLCFDTCEDAFVVGLACGDNVVEDSGQFVRRGSDRGGTRDGFADGGNTVRDKTDCDAKTGQPCAEPQQVG